MENLIQIQNIYTFGGKCQTVIRLFTKTWAVVFDFTRTLMILLRVSCNVSLLNDLMVLDIILYCYLNWI